MKLEKTFFVEAPPDKVAKAMRDAAFIEHDEKARDTVSVKVVEVKKTKDEHQFEIQTVNYVRGLTGIDRSKTENNKSVTRWDLKQNVCSWTWHGGGEYADKAKIAGGHSLIAQGKGTDVRMWVDIDVSVPLLGKTISKKVAAGFESEWPNYINRLNRWLKK